MKCQEASDEYERLVRVYPQYGYQMLEIPKVSIKDRFEFVMSFISG